MTEQEEIKNIRDAKSEHKKAKTRTEKETAQKKSKTAKEKLYSIRHPKVEAPKPTTQQINRQNRIVELDALTRDLTLEELNEERRLQRGL